MEKLSQLIEKNQRLALALKVQQEINASQRCFLARVAHELRSPLSSVMSLQQLILNDLCDSPAEEKTFIADSYQASQQLLAMLEIVGMVAKLSYGSLTVKIEALEIQDLFQELHALAALPIQNKNFRLTIRDPGTAIEIHGDRQKLLWAFRNLIDGALMATTVTTGEVFIAVEQPASDAVGVAFNLTLPCPGEVWQLEENETERMLATKIFPDLLPTQPEFFDFSPPIRYSLAQSVLSKMAGQIEIKPQTAVNSNATNTSCTVQITLLSEPLSKWFRLVSVTQDYA